MAARSNRLLGVVFLSASLAFSVNAQPGGGSFPHLEYVGTLHQLRLGNSEFATDFVTPKNWGGQPICLTKGSDLKITWVDEQFGAQWKVLSAKLISNVDGFVHWSTVTESPLMAAGTVYDLPGDMPTYIDWCKLEIVIASTQGASGGDDGEGGSGGGGSPPTLVGSNDVFVVLGQQQTPPNDDPVVGWVNVLKWATAAANHAEDSHTAKLLTTWKMYDTFTYDTSRIWWTDTSGSQEVFWAKMFFSQKQGQCNDFSDGLSMAFGQLGVAGTAPHRSYPNNGSKLRIHTDVIDPAGSASSMPTNAYTFWYHQFVLSDGEVWDSAIKITSGGTLVRVTSYGQTQYESDLVDYYWIDVDSDGAVDPTEVFYLPGPGSPLDPTLVTIFGNAETKTLP